MKIGDRVQAMKGGRFPTEGSFTGTIVGFSKWRNYDAANVRKDSPRNSHGATVQCLVKNLKVIAKHKRPCNHEFKVIFDDPISEVICIHCERKYPFLGGCRR